MVHFLKSKQYLVFMSHCYNTELKAGILSVSRMELFQQLIVGAIIFYCKAIRLKCDKVPVSASDKIHIATIINM